MGEEASARTSAAIDIIVPTRNRPEDLRRMLPTVAAQSHPDWRLFVIDQSDDVSQNLAAIAELASDRVVHVVRTQKGKSGALNHGLSLASSALLAFTDDDCTMPPDWLLRIRESFARDPNVGIVFGGVRGIECDPAEWFVPTLHIERRELFSGRPTKSHGVIGIGANMAVRREVFDRVGLFDEDLGPGARLQAAEECELTLRVLAAGFDVARDPSVDVLHWGARAIAGGAARNLINTAFFGIGAGYGKRLRDGDWHTAAVVGHETSVVFGNIALAAARRQRPLHIRRLAMLWKGIAQGFQRGPRFPRLNGHAGPHEATEP